jgi:hypothetical protein
LDGFVKINLTISGCLGGTSPCPSLLAHTIDCGHGYEGQLHIQACQIPYYSLSQALPGGNDLVVKGIFGTDIYGTSLEVRRIMNIHKLIE